MDKNYNFGAYPTMITPYTDEGKIDFDTVKKYVKFYYDNGCDGIFSVCQSSEIAYLTVEERAELNKTVYDEVIKLSQNGGRRMTVVSSGHVADSIDDQAHELNLIAESGTDALILITNRLDINNEGDGVWIKNAEALLEKLPKDIGLGLYECPLPYKRLVTPKILKWCLDTGRFYFMKDTCCDAAMIRERLEILKGSHFKLLNANCQTLLDSLRNGGAGYCGIMCNYHPAIYVWLCKNFEKEPHIAALVQSFICMCGFTEVGLAYPLTAKYHMGLCGIPTVNYSRNRRSEELTDYARDCMKQMKLLSDYIESKL